jgi:F-type H+-transporting ATPase subunit a
MQNHYTYLHSLGIADPNTQAFITAVAGGLTLVLLGSYSAKRLTSRRARFSGSGDPARDTGLVPEGSITVPGLFDLFIEIFVSFQDSLLGRENRKYLPLTATVFLYLFFLNIIGLIPGVPAATTTVWATVPVAVLIFCSFNYFGIKEHGLKNYLKHFAGPVWWLAWFIFPLEIFGALLRIVTLNLRLYWNITADHMVLSIFSDLVPVFVPIVFYGLGTFVCFMQAFVPTVLTMIYILLATQHEEGEHEHQAAH